MDIIQTCETIELWINSCKTREQLELLDSMVIGFFNVLRFPEIRSLELEAHEDILRDKIKFRIEHLLFAQPNSIVTNTFTSNAAKS